MENTRRRTWTRALHVPVLAAGVALVAAVSSWAATPASTTPARSPTPAAQQELTPVQDTQTTPAPAAGDQDGAGGGKGDCPEHDGGASGAGSSGTAAPQSTTPESTGSNPAV